MTIKDISNTSLKISLYLSCQKKKNLAFFPLTSSLYLLLPTPLPLPSIAMSTHFSPSKIKYKEPERPTATVIKYRDHSASCFLTYSLVHHHHHHRCFSLHPSPSVANSPELPRYSHRKRKRNFKGKDKIKPR